MMMPLRPQPVPDQGVSDDEVFNATVAASNGNAETSAEGKSGESKEELMERAKEMKRFECAVCFGKYWSRIVSSRRASVTLFFFEH